MKKSKAILMALCAVLLVAASVMGTLAYLTSTDTVVNTFTVGNVAITLDEVQVNANGTPVEDAARVQENTYKLLPGHTYTKDPTVHVTTGSEDCYLFVKVVNEIAAIEDPSNTIASQMTANGWAVVDADNGIYVYGTAAAPTAVSAGQNKKVFDNFTISGSVKNDTLAAYDGETIVIDAYAVQKDGFTGQSASYIWGETFGKTTTPDPTT